MQCRGRRTHSSSDDCVLFYDEDDDDEDKAEATGTTVVVTKYSVLPAVAAQDTVEVPTTPPTVTPSPTKVAETKIDSAKPVLAYEKGKTTMEISKAKKAIE